MGRPLLAFLVAPLWVPLIVAPVAAAYIFPYAAQAHWVAISTIISAIFAYAGMLLFGVPMFLLLQRRPRALLGAATVLGFAAGALTSLAFTLLFGLSLGLGWAEVV